MTSALRSIVAVIALAIAAFTAASAGAVHLSAEVYALTGTNRLVSFSAASPGEIETSVEVSGLQAGETLVGIDFRPRDGKLWGVGRVGTTGRMYTIDPGTGVATLVAKLTAAGSMGATDAVLAGSSFGVDFNPAADALRIVSDTGHNLRAIPSATSPTGAARVTGDTFVDGTPNYAGVTATGVGGAAYTNNDNDPATGTTLFDVDTRLDDLVRQDPPNGGTLVRVGDLGTPTESHAGFDIRPLRTTNVAYVATTEQRGNGATLATLHTIDLATGQTATLGKIGGPKTVRGIAVAP
jgi:hypothetical protein